jgi:DNA-binding response OmpR family regulator
LAEGDSLLRKSLPSYLSFNGFKIIQVGDGVEALNELTKSKFDLMILELKMPQIGGLEILNIVRNELMLTTPIIILSGSGVEEVEVESLQMGANDFISKPFSPLVIKARMDNLLENVRGKFIKSL